MSPNKHRPRLHFHLTDSANNLKLHTDAAITDIPLKYLARTARYTAARTQCMQACTKSAKDTHCSFSFEDDSSQRHSNNSTLKTKVTITMC